MADYDISAEIREDTHWWWPRGFTKRRKRSSLFRTMRSRDAYYAFRVRSLSSVSTPGSVGKVSHFVKLTVNRH